MFANEKNGETESHYGFGVIEIKRFFQWVLGCTYAKKTLRTRMAEMFHFADAPHIVVYERSEERPWYWMVGIITAVLVGVLSLYYTIEAGFRSVRKFMYSVLQEPPQSTVSTPRCLSPTTPSSKKTSPQTPKIPEVVRQKVSMNEPVNCVFIRPVNPKLIVDAPVSVPNLNSEEDVTVDPEQMITIRKEKENKEKDSLKEKREKKKSPPTMRLDEVQFDASSNFNIVPTMAPSPQVHTNSTQQSNRKSTGSDGPELPKTSFSECDQTTEWVMKQIAACKNLEADRSKAGACDSDVLPAAGSGIELKGITDDFMQTIQQLLAGHLGQLSVLETSSGENISEMSMVADSIATSLIEIAPSSTETHFTETLPFESVKNCIAKQTTGNAKDADVVVDDSFLFSETGNETTGSVLLGEEKQNVLFRYKDQTPSSVDAVTLTGSFFGWKMNIPMKRNFKDVFEVCIELPAGMHDYSISIYRFD